MTRTRRRHDTGSTTRPMGGEEPSIPRGSYTGEAVIVDFDLATVDRPLGQGS